MVSSDETAPVSIGGGVGTDESAWGSTLGELAPRGERTVTLGRRFGVFFIACRAVVGGDRNTSGCVVACVVYDCLKWYSGNVRTQKKLQMS